MASPLGSDGLRPTEQLPAGLLSENNSTTADKAVANAKRLGFLSTIREDIRPIYSDIPVLACCAVSGLCDSVAFNATGTFTSMQTGNTVFLALGAAGLPANNPHLWLRAIVSIGCFWAGCLIFSRVFSFRPKHKLTLTMSFALQAICILISAALAQSQTVPSFGLSNLSTTLDETQKAARDVLEDDAKSLAPLALLAFQFGGQIVASRVLGFNEVPTTVLTSLYCDMLSDPLLMAGVHDNPKRNRRAIAMVLLLGGAIVGGWVQRTSAGMAAVLWIAGGIKAVLALAWLIWKSKDIPKESMV